MAIVNFSVPADVKKAFDRTFKRQNKSAVIADLMRRAVAEAQLKERRVTLFRDLTAKRSNRPRVTKEQVRASRMVGRA